VAGVRIDLHTHSDASDGTDTPAELVANARAAGLDVVAITDHDTTAGWDEAIAARPDGLTLVPGAEFSCRWQPEQGRRISLHLLGYLFDRHDIALRAERARLRETRLTRGRTMVERMVADGVPITWAQIEALAGTGPVGRPHLGRALVAAGVVDSVDAAFAGPISSRSPYYEPKADTDVFTMIRLLRAAGGLPVFAHPIATRRGPTVSDEVVAEMAAAGLVGLEVDHPDHGPDDRARAVGLARELGLVATGSSDYHGTNKTRNPLGACLTEPEQFGALLEHACAGEPVR
jgi:predicted metal-dependent phosphoesterase TrpH